MALFERMTAVWNAWIGSDAPPSRSCVSGGSLNPDALVELVASAALPGPDANRAPIERYGLVGGAGRPPVALFERSPAGARSGFLRSPSANLFASNASAHCGGFRPRETVWGRCGSLGPVARAIQATIRWYCPA